MNNAVQDRRTAVAAASANPSGNGAAHARSGVSAVACQAVLINAQYNASMQPNFQSVLHTVQ